jgi:hypothetical protein
MHPNFFTIIACTSNMHFINNIQNVTHGCYTITSLYIRVLKNVIGIKCDIISGDIKEIWVYNEVLINFHTLFF